MIWVNGLCTWFNQPEVTVWWGTEMCEPAWSHSLMGSWYGWTSLRSQSDGELIWVYQPEVKVWWGADMGEPAWGQSLMGSWYGRTSLRSQSDEELIWVNRPEATVWWGTDMVECKIVNLYFHFGIHTSWWIMT